MVTSIENIDTHAREVLTQIINFEKSEFSHLYGDHIDELEGELICCYPPSTFSHYHLQFMAEQRAKEAAFLAQYKADKVCN